MRNDPAGTFAEKIRDLLEKQLFDAVIATKFYNHDHSVYERFLHWEKLRTPYERELCDGLEEYIDMVCEKSIYTCVNSDLLQRLCQLNDGVFPEKVFIAGADTECCVLKIATDLFEYNIRPVVLTGYCSSNGGNESHKAGILCMKRLIGENQLSDIVINNAVDLEKI